LGLVVLLVGALLVVPVLVAPDQEEDIVLAQSTPTLVPVGYLPLMYHTNFQEFWYSDDFQDTGSGWPYHSGDVDYGYKTDSDGQKVYHIRMDDEDDILFVTAPTKAPLNFEMETLLRRGTTETPKYWYDEYGVVLSPAPIDPDNISGSQVYTFHIRLRAGNDQPSYYVISKWNTLNKSDRTNLKGPATVGSEYMTDVAKFWNQFRIERSGDTLRFYLNRPDQSAPPLLVHTLTDPSLPDVLYIGYYASHSEDDFGSYVIEIQYDNLTLHAYP
jgi:hypothetical protein